MPLGPIDVDGFLNRLPWTAISSKVVFEPNMVVCAKELDIVFLAIAGRPGPCASPPILEYAFLLQFHRIDPTVLLDAAIMKAIVPA